MKRNPSRYYRQKKESPVIKPSSFARFSGIITPRKKPPGNEKMISEKTIPTYLLTFLNLDGELLLKGVSL